MGKTAKKPGKSARPVKTATTGARKTYAGRRSAAGAAVTSRSKLERVRVPAGPGRRDETKEGKYVYCVIRSDEPLSFGPLGLGAEPS
jgi:hypothetical protein